MRIAKYGLACMLMAQMQIVHAQSYPLPPNKSYAGKPCFYFTRPPVEADGGRMNVYAPGAVVVYGNYTYQCQGGSRTWTIVANKPDFYSDWQSRHAAVVEGTGPAPNLESGQQTLEDFVKSPGTKNSSPGGSGQTNQSGSGPEMDTSELEKEILAEMSPGLRQELASRGGHSAETTGKDLDAGGKAGSSATMGAGSNSDAEFAVCRQYMASLETAPTQGSQCGLAKKLVDYVNRIEPGLTARCANHPEFPRFIAGLRELRRTSQQTLSAVCVGY